MHAHGVHVVDLLDVDLETVEDEDRQVRVVREVLARDVGRVVQLGGDAVLAADVEFGQRVGVRTHGDVLGDAERGVEDLDGVDHVFGRYLDDLLAADARGVTREALLAHLGVARDHHVVDALHLVEQLDVEFRLVVVGHFAALHAEEAYGNDDMLPFREAQRVAAVGIGCRTDGRPLDQHHGARNRGLGRAVGDASGERNPLGGGTQGPFAEPDDDRILADREVEPRAFEHLAENLLDGSLLAVYRDSADGLDLVAVVEQQIPRLLFDLLENVVERCVRHGDGHPFFRMVRLLSACCPEREE